MTRENLLRKAKIDKSDVALLIDHEILGLQVSVAVVSRMQVLEGLDNTSGVKSRNRVLEGSFIAECSPKITAKVGISEDVDEFFI